LFGYDLLASCNQPLEKKCFQIIQNISATNISPGKKVFSSFTTCPLFTLDEDNIFLILLSDDYNK